MWDDSDRRFLWASCSGNGTCFQKCLAPLEWFGAYNPINACAKNWVGLFLGVDFIQKNLQDSQNDKKNHETSHKKTSIERKSQELWLQPLQLWLILASRGSSRHNSRECRLSLSLSLKKNNLPVGCLHPVTKSVYKPTSLRIIDKNCGLTYFITHLPT